MKVDRKTSVLAGCLYLVLLFGSGFAEVTRNSLIVGGDAVTTAANILSHEALFKASLISDLVGQTAFLLLGLALYKLFAPANRKHAILLVVFVAVSVPMAMLNQLNQFAALHLLGGIDYLQVFSPEQLTAQAMFYLDLRQYGVYITGIFWGLWLFPFGLLVYRSGCYPRLIGALLMVGCFGYLIDFGVRFLLPGFPAVAYPGLAVATVAELSAIGMLLYYGLKRQVNPV